MFKFRTRVLVCALLPAIMLMGPGSAVPPAGAAPVATDLTFTGTLQQWVVPAGVETVMIEAWGGHGSTSLYSGPSESAGGAGGYAKGTFAVTPGSTLDVTVAGDGVETNTAATCGGPRGCGGYGGGGSAQYGGGGGGASRVQVNGGSLLLVAGGGGGAGENQPCESDFFNAGGTGGDAGGTGGVGGPCSYQSLTVNGGQGGQPGTDSAGGTGGTAGTATGSDPCYFFFADSNGASATTGAGANGYEGGAGGGGYYGGGAGGDASEAMFVPGPPCDSLFPMVGAGAGGGGGGSNYLAPVGTDTTTGTSNRTAGQNGLVRITIPEYQPDGLVAYKTATPVGDNIFNLDGSGQTAKATRPVGKKAAFWITLQNDGSPVQDMVALQGPKKGQGFIVTYADGDQLVTNKVASGTYLSGALDPAGEMKIKVVVVGSAPGKHSFLVTLSSEGDPTRQDAVKVVLKNT